MSDDRYNILLGFSRGVKAILGKNLRKVILYGSYARGDYNDNSDVDIMILTTLTDSEIEKVETKIFDLAFDYEMEYGIEISVVIKNEEHFNYWLGALPFYNNIQKEGILLNG
ncbi:nucleotidyltransferase domain-containing protein [Faecalimonas sp. LCP19S3_D12]